MLYDLGPRARRVYQLLLGRIRSGDLRPGTRLPAHTVLAASFGVAPLTVRQVLARLEAEHLVVRERGRGTFVRGGDGQHVLIVAPDAPARAAVEAQIRATGQRAVLAATPSEALAALQREAPPWLVIVEPNLGLGLVRTLRQRLPDAVLAVLNPSASQQTRLERRVAPPLRMLGGPPFDRLSDVLHIDRPRRDIAPFDAADLLLERYVELQLAGERAEARALLLRDGMASGLSFVELCRRVLQPAQYRIGELWQGNRISVAREHLATAVTETVMADLAASAPRRPDSGVRVVVACVEGELHSIGARMVADILEIQGFRVRFLGADVPTDSLVALLRDELPRLLVLSAAMTERLATLRHAIGRVRESFGARVRIFVGGQVMQWAPDTVRALDVDLAAADAYETLLEATQLLADGVRAGERSSAR